MADLFQLSGSYSAAPMGVMPSGVPEVLALIDERRVLIAKQLNSLDLEVDGATPVAFSNIARAQVLVIKVTGGWCDAIITTSEGATQKIPVGGFLALTFDDSVPLTALSLSRQPATPVTVQVFLGQSS